MTRPRPDPTLGRVVRRLRKGRGFSQEDLAFGSGVTVSALSRIERGLTDPVWGHVRALARALDVSLDKLGAAVEQEHCAPQIDVTSATANEQGARHSQLHRG